MRIAVLIIGLLLSVWTFFEAFVLAFLETNNILASDDADSANVAGGGLLVAICGVVAASLAIAYPLASTILFGLAGAISILTAGSGYGNHWVYGPIFLLLSVMAFFGWRGKRKERNEAAEVRLEQFNRDQRLETILQQQQAELRQLRPQPEKVTFPNFCPSCKHRNEQTAKFCAECGATLAPA